MTEEYSLGIYSYYCKIDYDRMVKMPEQFKMKNISSVGIIILLLIGEIIIKDNNGKVLAKQRQNYTNLPVSTAKKFSYRKLNTVLGIDVKDEVLNKLCDRFLIRDRRNNFVYDHVLNELTQYFVIKDVSPSEGFLHLYRLLEFMSYSFPLMYASKSKDYKGSYESLKKFMSSGEKSGELKFFGRFLDELFKDEEYIYNFDFDAEITTANFSAFVKDFSDAIKADLFFFEDNVLHVKFKDVKDIFIDIRNKYFHMLLGNGGNNFLNMDYDKNDIFRNLNPLFLNWIASIFSKIIQQELSLYD